MKTVRSQLGRLAGFGLAAMLIAPALQAQTTTMPSSQRYGSGYLDIPVASVIPHMAITGTFSGFFVNLDRRAEIDERGRIVGFGPALDEFYGDGSIYMGLFDRLEFGAAIHALQDSGEGGNTWGVFGRLALLKPEDAGIGLAAGARYVVSRPDFGDDGVDYQMGRLGYNDYRLHQYYPTDGANDDFKTDLTPYGVATANLRGWDAGFLPQHDISVTLGYGGGLFTQGDWLQHYAYTDADGWFMGSAIHMALGDNSLLHLMGEYNGFDVNMGAQLDLSGLRIGANYLASNYNEPAGGYYSEYRTPKFGVLASICIDGGLCKPHLMDRPAPEIVQLPAAAPDTVRITRDVTPPLPDGTLSSVCLSTGEAVQIRVTAQGDTLVGPSRVSIRTLRPGVVFAGQYAMGRTWYENDSDITFEQYAYQQTGNPVRLDCPDLMRIGEYMGVPLFAMRNANRPFETIYVPVRPGYWHAYQRGIRRTRGQ